MAEPNNMIPWLHENYEDHVLHWIRDELDKVGLHINGNIERVKETDISLVLRIPTNDGDFFVKDGSSASKHEAILSKQLHQMYPGKTGDVLAINEVEGWLFMKDIGGQPLRARKDKKLWQRALREFAELQVAELENVDRLLGIGVPDRRMHVLKTEIEQYLEEMCATGLSNEETRSVMALLPDLLAMCDELDAIIPASLEHGDLHTNNIRLVANNLVFFDWGDASISHPFFSTRIFWHALDDLIASEAEWLAMVEEFRPFYLEPWTKLAPMKELDRALRISDELACVQRALSWHLYITPNRVNREESWNKPSQWLQLFLEHRVLVGR